jgi:hypothetical protein
VLPRGSTAQQYLNMYLNDTSVAPQILDVCLTHPNTSKDASLPVSGSQEYVPPLGSTHASTCELPPGNTQASS